MLLDRSVTPNRIIWQIILCLLLITPGTAWAAQCAPETALARLVSAQGRVTLNHQAVERNTLLCPDDVIRTGPFSRAALMLLPTESMLRLGSESILRLPSPPQPEQSLLDLLRGVIHIFSREPPTLEVYTPLVNAAVKGTEFTVSATAERSLITVFEGQVLARNEQGELLIGSQQSAQARPDQAPRLIEILRPEDAVQWALYYQPILQALYDPAAPLANRPEPWDYNDPATVLARLQALSEPSPEQQVLHAAWLLAAGQGDAAQAMLQKVPPGTRDAQALAAIIALTRNDKTQALRLARQTVQTTPSSAAAQLALSYAQQAHFELDSALQSVQAAHEQNSNNALVLARLSELWLAQGELERAVHAAQQAVALNPAIARSHTVLGFAQLSQIDLAAARQAFERAQELDQTAPLPRLGLGLVKIRTGELHAGREQLAIAVSLNPQSSLLRSYLGKAYAEERRGHLAEPQFQIAKALDSFDPTPWLYDALLKQILNRPIGALHDIQRSIELNDHRAVYRSQLLLDEDEATRGARQGLIYRDLGFEQLALTEGWQALAQDPANDSAHRLLADTYIDLPRHEIARDSELLQAQLLQPLNINPVQPLLASDHAGFFDNGTILSSGFNEYSPLFTRNQLRLYADGLYGSNNSWADNLIVSGIQDDFSFSFGQFRAETDGVRENNALEQEIFNLFAQFNLSSATSLQAELRHTEENYGDRRLLFLPDNFHTEEHNDDQFESYRLGFRHDFTPNSTLIGSFFYNQTDAHRSGTGFPVDFFVDSDERFAELRHLYKAQDFHLTTGLGHLDGTALINLFSADSQDFEHTNAYVYATSVHLPQVTATVGLGYDRVDNIAVDKDQFNPKFGLVWRPLEGTSIRTAAFRTLKRIITSSQTLEPTNLAGFNQFFDDPNSADVWRYGIGIDQVFSPALAAGIEASRRELEVPRLFSAPDEQTEKFIRAYAYWTPTQRFAVSAEYQYESYEHPLDGSGNEFFVNYKLHRLPLQLSYFAPSGFYSRLRGTYLYQKGLFLDAAETPISGEDRFWIADAEVGFRLAKYQLQAALEVRNLFDNEFQFQDRGFTDPGTVSREREVFARLSFTF